MSNSKCKNGRCWCASQLRGECEPDECHQSEARRHSEELYNDGSIAEAIHDISTLFNDEYDLAPEVDVILQPGKEPGSLNA